MRAVAASLATLVLLTSGCMTVRSADSGALGDASASSSPAPDLVGTWSGTAFAVGGSSYLISTPVGARSSSELSLQASNYLGRKTPDGHARARSIAPGRQVDTVWLH